MPGTVVSEELEGSDPSGPVDSEVEGAGAGPIVARGAVVSVAAMVVAAMVVLLGLVVLGTTPDSRASSAT